MPLRRERKGNVKVLKTIAAVAAMVMGGFAQAAHLYLAGDKIKVRLAPGGDFAARFAGR
jgi:hypothetical protein